MALVPTSAEALQEPGKLQGWIPKPGQVLPRLSTRKVGCSAAFAALSAVLIARPCSKALPAVLSTQSVFERCPWV